MFISKLLRNLSSNYVTAACSALVSLYLTPLLFNYLHASHFGLLVFAIAAEALLETVDFGIMSTTVRFVSVMQARRQLAEIRELVSTLFFLALAVGALWAMLLAGGSSLIVWLFSVRVSGMEPQSVAMVIAVIGTSCLPEMPATALRGYLHGIQDFHLSNVVEVLAILIRAGWMLAAMHAGYGLVAIGAAYPVASVVRLGAMLVVVRRIKVPCTPRWSQCNRRRLRELGPFALWSFADENVRLLFAQADVLVATRMLPVAEVGLLSIGRRIPAFIQRFASQAAVVGYPIASEAAARSQQSNEALQRFTLVTARNTLAFFMPLGAVLILWAQDILRLWIGPEAVPAATTLQLFVLFALLAGLTDHVINVLYAAGDPRSAAVVAAGQLVGGIPLAFWAALHFGMTGIAAALVAAEFVSAVLFFRIALQKIQLPSARFLRMALLPVLLAGLPAASAVVISFNSLPHNLVGLAISSFAASLLFLFFFGLVVTGWASRPLRSRLRHLLVDV